MAIANFSITYVLAMVLMLVSTPIAALTIFSDNFTSTTTTSNSVIAHALFRSPRSLCA